MVVNSYILKQENVKPNKIMTCHDFTKTVVNTIGTEWQEYKNQGLLNVANPNPPNTPRFGIFRLDGNRKRLCNTCSTPQRKRKSHFACVRCQKGLHSECIANHKC